MTHAADSPDPEWPSLLPSGPPPATVEIGPDEIGADDDLFADAEPARRVGRLTAVLAAALLVVAGFAGGALAARRNSTTTVGGGAAAAAGGAGGFAGFRGGGRQGGGQGGGQAGGQAGGQFTGGAGGQFAAGAAPGAAGGGAPTTGTAAGGPPAVVGTVASVGSDRITVKNFAGAKVVVRVPAGTPVTSAGLGGLRAGQTVLVQGTRAKDGTVTATAVTARS